MVCCCGDCCRFCLFAVLFDIDAVVGRRILLALLLPAAPLGAPAVARRELSPLRKGDAACWAALVAERGVLELIVVLVAACNVCRN